MGSNLTLLPPPGGGAGTDVTIVGPLSGGAVAVDGSGVTQPVIGPLTDAELRATSVPVALPNDASVSGPAAQSIVNTDLLTGVVSGWYDAAAFHSGAVQIIATAGISAGAVIFEQTNDTTLAPSGATMPVQEPATVGNSSLIGAQTIAASTARIFTFRITCRYVRVRISTAFVGGTVRAVGVFSQQPWNASGIQVLQPTAANLNATIAALPAGTNLAADVGIQNRANATGAASITSVLSPATAATATIKASAGRLLGWQFLNSAAAFRSVKVFNATAPTLGTTAAIFEIDIPAGAAVSFNIPGGLGFATAMTYIVTAGKGLTNNDSTGLVANDVSGSFFFA